MAQIELTKSQMDNLIDFFELNFIDSIRKDEEIDNLDYLVDMCDVYSKLKILLEEEKQNENQV